MVEGREICDRKREERETGRQRKEGGKGDRQGLVEGKEMDTRLRDRKMREAGGWKKDHRKGKMPRHVRVGERENAGR